MSIKDLFKNQGTDSVLSASTLENLKDKIGEHEILESYAAEKDAFVPHVDFTKPENFAKFGSAEKYYESAFTRIQNLYPYDGTRAEQLDWYNSSSYLDQHVFDYEYPRVNGYAKFSPDGWGTAASTLNPSHLATAGYYFGLPAVTEYILVKGGPAANSREQYKDITNSKGDFKASYGNVFDNNSNRESNLKFNASSGSTVEFWLKVDSLIPRGTDGGSDRMTLFDLWNGVTGSSTEYGRYEIFVHNDGTGSNAAFGVHCISGTVGTGAGEADSFVGFNSVSASAASEGLFTDYTKDSLADGSWHHYAFVMQNDSADLRATLYVDGKRRQEITKTNGALGEFAGSMVATIGANVAFPDFLQNFGTATTPLGRGLNKFSGSMDEFRYWKTARTPKDIGLNWYVPVYGGTNRSDANTDLGVYYKFNEGITTTASLDSTVLDYSGRICNGSWTISTGMVGSTYRGTGSAMVESDVVNSEYKDPILYPNQSEVADMKNKLTFIGKEHDLTNNASIFNSIPAWIQEGDSEDGDGHLSNLTQIISSYFDTLYLQVQSLPKLKEVTYPSSSFKPYSFSDQVLQSHGFSTAEIFADVDTLGQFAEKDEKLVFREKLHNVKNSIYNNIYNNLVFLYKTKGTEKSFRNFIRCFGIDEEIIRLNIYGNNITHEIKENYREVAYKNSYIDFNHSDRFGSTVYQYPETGNTNSVSFITGSGGGHSQERHIPITIEADILFPKKHAANTANYQPYDYITSSLFGCHTAMDDNDLTWGSPDYGGLQVYAVRDRIEGNQITFVLTGSFVPEITSSTFTNIYDNERWNFAVRVKDEKYPQASLVSGSFLSGSTTNKYLVEFVGVNAHGGTVVREFKSTGFLDTELGESEIRNELDGASFITAPKRFYVGAHRTNFTGNVVQYSDVKVGGLRVWLTDLDDNEVRAHARDAANYGVDSPYQNSYMLQSDIPDVEVPKFATLALNWDFQHVTGSDGDGKFTVSDVSSGSLSLASTRYDWVGNVTRKQHTARGENFPSNNKKVVDDFYVATTRQSNPDNIISSDMVNILDRDDVTFTRETRPINYFFAFEKSPYQNVSDEMIRLFATIKDFHNIIGEPVNRYRQEYKEMGKIRQLFFEKLANTPDVEKYIEFYKWVDNSISMMLQNFVPASAEFAENVRTVIESHVLERNKYTTKFPTMEFKVDDPEARIMGINELLYDWEFGHAPLNPTNGREDGNSNENTNCLWWKDRAERDKSPLDLGISTLDGDRQTLNNIITKVVDATAPQLAEVSGNSYTGSTYALRKLSRPYKFSADESKQIRAGQAYINKKPNFYKSITEYGANGTLRIPQTDLEVVVSSCDDKKGPADLLKRKLNFKTNVLESGVEVTDAYQQAKGDLIAPFTIFSSSVSTGYPVGSGLRTFRPNIDINNHHFDSYNNEAPLQGPFTEKHVGGLTHRHTELNTAISKTLDDDESRAEAWKLDISVLNLTVKNPGDDGPDKPRARYFRDETAKRPINIRNIQQSTSSVDSITFIGNYTNKYEVVHTTGRSVNNIFFNNSDGASNFPSIYAKTDSQEGLPKTTNIHSLIGINPSTEGRGNVFGHLGEGDHPINTSNRFSSATDYTLDTRGEEGSSNQKTVIANRFSSPGGPETLSRGFLDINAEEYSVYNALPFRNLSVRGPGSGEDGTIRMSNHLDGNNDGATARSARDGLRTILTRHCGQYGHDSTHGSVLTDKYVTVPSFHKINRNGRKRLELAETADYLHGENIATTESVYDNWYVQHPIPQSDMGYAWISASVDSSIFGFATGSSELSFITESSAGSVIASTGQRVYIGDRDRVGFSAATGFIGVDFAGMNTNIYEPITEASNFIGYDSLSVEQISAGYRVKINYVPEHPAGDGDPDSDGQDYNAYAQVSSVGWNGVAATLNGILIHRNGPYGYPSWKQTRTGLHPVARDMRKKNRYSIITQPRTKTETTFNTDGLSRWEKYQRDLLAIQGKKVAEVLTSYTEPPVAIKYKPITHKLTVGKQGSNTTGREEIVINHTFGNNLSHFANNALNNNIASEELRGDNRTLANRPKQAYDDLLDIYEKGALPPAANPVESFNGLFYSETVFPKEKNTFLNKVRSRTQYAETTGHATNGIDRKDRRTFWNNDENSMGLTIDSALNSQGMVDNGQGRTDLSNTKLSVWPLGPTRHRPEGTVTIAGGGSLSATYNRADYFGELWPAGTYESLHTTASLSFMRTLSTSGTGSTYLVTGYDNPTLTASIWEPFAVPGKMKPYYAHDVRGKSPWFNNYEDYASDIRVIGQDHSIVPEFRISDHIDFYMNERGGNFRAKNNMLFMLDGGNITASAGPNRTSRLDDDFYDTYSHSDFLKYFNMIQEDHSDTAVSRITLKCSGVKKLLPYNGFYPALRSVQLGSLLSQSLGPFIGGSKSTGSAYFNGTNSTSWAPTYDFGAQRLNALLQPLMAPGVFFNSIKSGIAVDYPVYKGSAPEGQSGLIGASFTSFEMSALTEAPNYRLPFEALVDFKNYIPISSSDGQSAIHFVETSPAYRTTRTSDPSLADATFLSLFSADADASDPAQDVFFDWNGSFKPSFPMASHNFLAEVPRFFLKNGKLTSAFSAAEKDFKPMVSGTVYYMDVVLRRTKDLVISEGPVGNRNQQTGYFNRISPHWGDRRGSIYGPALSGTWADLTVSLAHQHILEEGTWTLDTPHFTANIGGVAEGVTSDAYNLLNSFINHSAWTPPYFYGDSVARISFSPHDSGVYGDDNPMDTGASAVFSLDEILAGAEVTYFNKNPYLDTVAGTATGSVHGNSLPVQNCMQLSSSVNLLGKTRVKKVTYSSQTDSEGQYVPTSITDSDTSAFDVWSIGTKWECPVLDVSGTHGDPDKDARFVRSIWNGYGNIPGEGTGLFLDIEESHPVQLLDPSQTTTGSLINVCGFNPGSQRVGEVADEKEISEAVVAIPFSKKKTNFTVNTFGSKHFFKILPGIYKKQLENITNGKPAVQRGDFGAKEDIQDTSISDMIKLMNRYVVPPNFDFLKYKTKTPFVMYIFEFTHTLDKDDLSDIWQNLMPEIAMTAEKEEVVVSHPTGKHEFFHGLPPFKDDAGEEIHWMIFKIKKKAERSYYNLTADSRDDDRFKFQVGNKEKEPDYSYNWPYDYFSLVELVKLDAGISIGPDAPFIPQSAISKEQFNEEEGTVKIPPGKNQDITQIQRSEKPSTRLTKVSEGERR